MRQGAGDFILTLAQWGAFTLCLLSASTGILVWVAYSPEFFEAVFMLISLAILSFAIGAAAKALQKRNQTELHSSPQIIGLELLTERWKEFNPKESDSVILYEHSSIIMSMARLEYRHHKHLRLLRYFQGAKIRAGAYLLQLGVGIPIVLKFDSVANITKEQEKYKACVADYLGQVPGEPKIPQQKYGKIDGQDWGAITYKLVGANQINLRQIQTFGDFYKRQSFPRINEVINRIFIVISHWWQNPPPKYGICGDDNNTLYSEYNRLTRNLLKMEAELRYAVQSLQIENLENINIDQQVVSFSSIHYLRNPLNWTRDIFGNKKLGDWAVQHRDDDRIVHGDFHSNNILISKDQNEHVGVWIIDFPHTHIGPPVQDVARLEADIKFGLLSDNILY